MNVKYSDRLISDNLTPFIGRLEFVHEKVDVRAAAFNLNENITLNIILPSNIICKDVVFNFYKETEANFEHSQNAVWTSAYQGYDVYSVTLEKGTLDVGLHFLRVEVTVGNTIYYSSGSFHKFSFSSDFLSGGLAQISITDPKYSEPSSILGGTIYHIFVDRFARSNEKRQFEGKDIIYNEWKVIPEYPDYPGAPLKNNTFYGGDLLGIADRLDYISSLGVTAIYLSPIFLSPSNHRYDTSDYMKIDPLLGSEDDLVYLIRKAQSKNIKVILDGVFNHTGADSIYFNKFSRFDSVGAYNSKESSFYEWYNFKSYPDSYECWWDVSILPRINTSLDSVTKYFVGKDGVIEHYRKLGIYGFRLDVADELPDTFIADIKSVLSSYGESVLYGEVWEDASNKIAYGRRKSYYNGTELDGVMNYPLRTGLISYVTDKDPSRLEYALTEVALNSPDRIMHAQMNLLGSHDTVRILTALGGAKPDGYSNEELSNMRMSKAERIRGKKLLRCIYTVLATLPGIPTVFYGDEVGLEGYSDPFNRMPYPYGKEDRELLSFYRTIGKIRVDHSVYKCGSFNLMLLTKDVLLFSRTDEESVYLTVMNNSDTSFDVDFSEDAKELIDSKVGASFKLKPETAKIFKTSKNTTITIKQ